MGILLRYRLGATTPITLTLAHPTATTDLAGSWAASSSAPAPGITDTGVAVDTGVAAATTVAVDTTATPGTTTGTMAASAIAAELDTRGLVRALTTARLDMRVAATHS